MICSLVITIYPLNIYAGNYGIYIDCGNGITEFIKGKRMIEGKEERERERESLLRAHTSTSLQRIILPWRQVRTCPGMQVYSPLTVVRDVQQVEQDSTQFPEKNEQPFAVVVFSAKKNKEFK
jgi:hypothetical protein